MSFELTNVNEVKYRSERTHDSGSDTFVPRDHGNKAGLQLAVFTTCMLAKDREATVKVLSPDVLLQNLVPPIDFDISKKLPGPCHWMVPEELVKLVQYVGCQKFGWIGELPVPPVRLVYAVQARFPGLSHVSTDVERVYAGLVTQFLNESKSHVACPKVLADIKTKFLVTSQGDWRSITSGAGDHLLFGVISNVRQEQCAN